jgi:hypothetical protein
MGFVVRYRPWVKKSLPEVAQDLNHVCFRRNNLPDDFAQVGFSRDTVYPGIFSLHNCNDFIILGCRLLMRTPQGRATPIEIEIAIEIGKLPEIDFDHDFDFDIDTELPRFESKNALHCVLAPADIQSQLL